MTACYKNAGRWLAGRRPPSYADPGPCPALCLALLAVCAFLVLASWLLQGDLYGRVFRETIVAVIITVVRGRGNTSFAADICATCLLQPVLVVAGPPLGVATAAVAAVARGAPYIFSSRHVLGLVTACILFMGMLQMMSGASGSRPAAAANTTVGVGVCDGVQQCCYGGRASRDGQWLQRNIPAAYPHAHLRDSCVTKLGAGAKVARDYKDWRTTRVVGGESFVVNLSARHCSSCHKKVQEAVSAIQDAQMGTGGVGAEAGVATAGGSGADVELDIASATVDVLTMQLLHRNNSLQRSLSQSSKELGRFVCMCVYVYMHMQIFDL